MLVLLPSRQAMIDEFDLDQDGEINLDVSVFWCLYTDDVYKADPHIHPYLALRNSLLS